ncbi:hypothetical protein [Idiomarina abyssalis]|uniref:hypothetical protein n=1 Tax=Idiomarina abyssalis TaxID=86102 RepID=UPI003A94028B
MLPGDILLVTGDGKLSKSLVNAQKFIYSKAISSHVEFCLGDGIFIHSTNDNGVHLTLLIDEHNACNGQWRVIRHKSIREHGESTELLQKAAMYYFAQSYNKRFMGVGNEVSSFCSELVAKAYKKTGIEIINGKSPSKVTPAHFDKEADGLVDWIDVTEEYQKILSDMQENEFPYRVATSTLSTAMIRRKVHEPHRQAILQSLEKSSGNEELVADMRAMLKSRELKFWHEKDS